MKRTSVLILTSSTFLVVTVLALFVEFHGRKNSAPLPSGLVSKPTSRSEVLMSERKKRVKGLMKRNYPNLFAQFHRDIRTRTGERGPAYPPNYRINQLLKSRSLPSTRALSDFVPSKRVQLDWVERGPGNIGGRTRGLLVDPEDGTLDSWYAGSVGGGVWKTTDAGQTWIDLTRTLPNLATSTLAMSASNPEVIYVGTGEGFQNVDQINGSGIWKTTDRGLTWEQLESTANEPEFQNVTRLIVDPHDDRTVLAATVPGVHHFSAQTPSSAIFRSQDGGLSWTKVFDAGANRVEQIVYNPQRFETQYASVNGMGVIKSTDGGRSWRDASSGIGGVRRMEIAISPVDTSRLYISAEGGSAGSTLFVSENSGETWLQGRPVQSEGLNWLGGQGWYDNTIAAHPFIVDRVFAGGVNLWQMDILPGIDSTDAIPNSVQFENTSSFLGFINFGGDLAGGGIAIGPARQSEFATVEIRFGQGKAQKAHRFTVPQGATSGVPSSDYTYRDYVEVPFELWDADNNRQLMVSFRDQTNNGQWELAPFNDATTREYLFLHSLDYEETPSALVTRSGGHTSNQLYFIWPVLAQGGVWEPHQLPEARLRINFGKVFSKNVSLENVTDGYGEFGGSTKGVHVDHHNLLLLPRNPATGTFRLLNANDGGVSFSDNAGQTFSQPLNGYNTTQFYGVDKKNGASEYIGGMQDNSTWRSPSGEEPDAASRWVFQLGGDGFECVWDYDNPNRLLASAQFNNIFRSLNGGVSWRNANTSSGLTDVGPGAAPFFSKLAKSKQDPDLIFAVGPSGVWRSDNFSSSWDLITMPESWQGNRSFTEVKISLANPQIVWAGDSMIEDRRPFVSTDGGLTFTETSLYSGATLGPLSGLETHPIDERTAYALFSFAKSPKVLRTTDLGQTWEDLSGFGGAGTSSNGFPDVAVYSLMVMPFDTNTIWAGTEIGLFESKDKGLSWAYADNGLPATAIFEMLIVNDEIVVATHGRGVWTLSLPELDGYEPLPATRAPRLNHAEGLGVGGMRADVSLRSAYDSSFVLVEGEKVFRFPENTAALDGTVEFRLSDSEEETVSVTIASFKDGEQFLSFSKSVTVVPVRAPQISYSNDFNVSTEDFILNGFELEVASGFEDAAIHSQHPYPIGSDLTATLRIPIIVASDAATISYDDIALVEPGDAGTHFGDRDFGDFVVVEGSSDFGQNWRPLAEGYDARYDRAWLDRFSNGGPIIAPLVRTHLIDLRDTYSPGTEILIRFRLFSDTDGNGWGWVIDNLKIQDNVVSVSEQNPLPTVFSLSQNFPNPFNPTTRIEYALPKSEQVTLRIFNIKGQSLLTLVSEKQNAGVQRVEWDGKDEAGRPVASGVYVYRIEAGDFVQSRKMTLLR